MFKNKNIVLCVTGGIACYKAVYLASLLKKNGANVFTVMTKNATEFVTPLTFKTVTKNRVTVSMFDNSDFVPHISLSELADIVIVAPATANIIAKASCGIADDMASTLLLSTKAEKFIIPAMNSNMYLNPVTQENIERLKRNGYKVMTPESGLLACGISGIGRFPESESIMGFIIKNMADKQSHFYGKRVLLTLGGTIEDIDPVRCITNRSTGKMGFAFAKEFIRKGAKLTILSGNVSDIALDKFKKLFPDEDIIKIRSAAELQKEVINRHEEFDVLFMASAVADYTPLYSKNKIKKSDENLILELRKTDDILKTLKKKEDKIYIGFAAESENLIQNAKDKLQKKSLNFLIANEITGEKAAIGNDKAEVFLLNCYNDEIANFAYSDKENIASNVLNAIESEINKA